MNLIKDIYCEWIEDLGVEPEKILIRLLEKKEEEIQYLKKRLNNYESRTI